MNSIIRFWTVLLVLALCAECVASVPGMMSYQGKLTGDTGQPLIDGTYPMIFSLYAQETVGTALWTESRSVQVAGGVFSVLLGSITEMPSSAFAGTTWLETTVNGTVLTPRTRIVSAGYAMLAKTAETMPNGSITSAMIAAGAVGSSAILDGGIAMVDLATSSVGGTKLADNAVTSPKILDGTITSDDLGYQSVIEAKIATGAVTASKLGADVVGVTMNVKQFGATGDGIHDDTLGFQNALNAASAANGGIVWVPTGTYKIATHLTIPSHVTLEGVFRAPPGNYTGNVGSTLLAYEGAGNENGTPFIQMSDESTIKGIAIFYPEQSNTSVVQYPWCIRGANNNCTVMDVMLVNPWRGLDFGTQSCGRHMIQRVYGQPIKTGLYVDQVLDVGRVQDVHFWPFWHASGAAANYTAASGTAFHFRRADWEFVSGCFAISYNIGFLFTPGVVDGLPNVLVTNSGADMCNFALQVEAGYDTWGHAFTNCQFFGMVDIKSTNNGYVKFNNCGFWARSSSGYCVKTAGAGAVVFTGCHFANYDANSDGKAAIYDDGARLTVNGCDFFQSGKRQLIIAATNPYTVVLIGNTYRGGRNIQNLSGTVQLTEAHYASR